MEDNTNITEEQRPKAAPETDTDNKNNTEAQKVEKEPAKKPVSPAYQPETLRRVSPVQPSSQSGFVRKPPQSSSAPERPEYQRRATDRRATDRRVPERRATDRRTSDRRGAEDREEGRRLKREPHNRRATDRLVFGVVPRATMSLIFLVVLVIVSMIFAVKMTEVRVPIFIVVLIVEILMGIFLKETPSFVAILLVAALTVVGALTGMFIPICISNSVMLSSMMMAKGT